jgi:hypothetical protein
MDRGSELTAEVCKMLNKEYPIKRKLITTQNPQANAIIERIHQVVHNMIRVQAISGKKDVKEMYKLEGVLAAVCSAVLSVVHTTTRATPTQLVFGRDTLLNISFEADWQCIKERKQRLIVQNNCKENSKRIPHEYKPGDEVMIRLNSSRKHGEAQFEGPYTVARVNDNGTVQLSKATPHGGAVYGTLNIRNLDPCMG